MASTRLRHFHLFGRLPVELRLAIWEFCLPDDVPEIYFIDPANFTYDFNSIDDTREETSEDEWVDETFADAKVTIGYPAMMHTCHEARLVAVEKLSFQQAQLRCGSRVWVPCRDFRPSLDTFYINSIDTGMLNEVIYAREDDTWYKDIRHVALQAECLVDGTDDLCPHLVKFSSLRKISIVYGRSWSIGPLNFHDPDAYWNAAKFMRIRHYRLKSYTKETGCLVHGSNYSSESVKTTIEDFYDTMRLVQVREDSPWDGEAKKWLFRVEPKVMVRRPQYGLARPRLLSGRGSVHQLFRDITDPVPGSTAEPSLAARWLSLFNFNAPLTLLQQRTTA